MMTSPRSDALSDSDSRTLRAEAHTFFCASGTILGRRVVPDVCSTRAMSCGDAVLGGAFGAGLLSVLGEMSAENSKVNVPDPFSGCGRRRAIGMFRRSATAMHGESLSLAATSSLARR